MSHRTDARNENLGQASTEKRVIVSRDDLPLSCPAAKQKLWNSHPRVYLPIEESGEAHCPYCGTHYALSDQSTICLNTRPGH